MLLNASSVIPLFTCRYSGVARYLANAASQPAVVSGGSVPTIGCHSVIDRPECVRRVTPPTTMIANTSAEQAKSHAATARGGRCVSGDGVGEAAGAAASCGEAFTAWILSQRHAATVRSALADAVRWRTPGAPNASRFARAGGVD
jgi:hypothetical protein